MDQPRDDKGRFLAANIQSRKRKRGQNLKNRFSTKVQVVEEDVAQVISNSVLTGRRVVDLNFLSQQLDDIGCSSCHERLQLKHCTKETIRGLGSYLHIVCDSCRWVTKVRTGKTHCGTKDDTQNCKSIVFDVNTKAAAGMLFLLYSNDKM